jgi:uncharacterized membrane protein
MIEFDQNIDDKKYKKAIAIHYFGYKYTYISPILGFLVLIIMLMNLILIGEFQQNQIILAFLGAFFLIRPFLYVQNVFKSIKTKNFGTNETRIKFTDDEKIIVEIGENSSKVNLKDLYAYYNKGYFLFLYIARNQYLIIDKTKLTEEQLENIINILNRLGIKKR